MFKIKNVSKQYQEEYALRNISLTIGKGLNFITGASGSGKTTLLKIMSGFEKDFEGEVSYDGKQINDITENEKSYMYNHVFGFIWQDFHLLEDNTVLENVLLPQILMEQQHQKRAKEALRQLEILDIADKKVKLLSGGQKQRVAIARELMKNPQVILADEPTSALDRETAKETMEFLRLLSKSITVIIVTHDTSFIKQGDRVYELDKGELISKVEVKSIAPSPMDLNKHHALSLHNAFTLAKINIKNKFGRYAIALLTLVVASVLMLSSVSGTILGNSKHEFDKLFETYGDSLTDISIYKGFSDATGTGGEQEDKPKGDVSQDIRGLYDGYATDNRVAFLTFLQAFDNIHVTMDGQEHKIQSSGNTPVINKIVSGKMPMGANKEVAVPESFVKKLGLSNEEVLGKEIEFKGSIVDWATGNPVWKDTKIKVTIVGVMDTTIKSEYEGQMNEYVIDDSFLFNKVALEDLTNQAGVDMNTMSFLIRAKTPADMIAIKDELSKKGIVPLGRFELVEDMVRLDNQATTQSGVSSVAIAVLALSMVIAVFVTTGSMRKKEIAIYKVSGFTKSHLFILNVAEMLSITGGAIVFMILTSPLLNMGVQRFFGTNILSVNMLGTGVIILVCIACIAGLFTSITFARVKIITALKTGDR